MISRRGFFRLLGGAVAAVTGKPLLALAPESYTTPWMPIEKAFDIKYVQSDLGMVFKPKFYFASVTIESAKKL